MPALRPPNLPLAGARTASTAGLRAALHRFLQHLADAANVYLLSTTPGWAVVSFVRRACRKLPNGTRTGRSGHRGEHVFRLARVPLLAERAAGCGRACMNTPGWAPSILRGTAGRVHDPAVRQLSGVFAEVPDVAAAVLCVVVAGALFDCRTGQ